MKYQNILNAFVFLFVSIPFAHAQSSSDCSLPAGQTVINNIVKNDDFKDPSGIDLHSTTIKTNNHLTAYAVTTDNLYWSFVVVCDGNHKVVEKGFQQCQTSGDFVTAKGCNYVGDLLVTQADGSIKKQSSGKPAQLPYLDASGNFEIPLSKYFKSAAPVASESNQASAQQPVKSAL